MLARVGLLDSLGPGGGIPSSPDRTALRRLGRRLVVIESATKQADALNIKDCYRYLRLRNLTPVPCLERCKHLGSLEIILPDASLLSGARSCSLITHTFTPCSQGVVLWLSPVLSLASCLQPTQLFSTTADQEVTDGCWTDITALPGLRNLLGRQKSLMAVASFFTNMAGNLPFHRFPR